jgi:hypothetical protein
MRRRLASVLQWLVAFAVILQPVSQIAEAFDPLDIDGRIDHAKNDLLELERQAEKSGNQLIIQWANHMVDVLDHLNDELTEQQATLWRQADTQRQRFFNDLNQQIKDIRNGADLTLDRVEYISNEFEDTLTNVLRGSKEPYLTRYAPTFLVPTSGVILLHLRGKYLQRAKLIDYKGRIIQAYADRENTADFQITEASLPTPKDAVALVSFSVEIQKERTNWDVLFFRHPVQNYKISYFVLPPHAAASISVHAIKLGPRETSWVYEPAENQEPHILRSPKEDVSALSPEYCVNPDPGYVFSGASADWQWVVFERGDGCHLSNAGMRRDVNRMCSQGSVSPNSGCNAGVKWSSRYKEIKLTRDRVKPDPLLLDYTDIVWKKDIPVSFPEDSIGWYANVKYFDGEERTIQRAGDYRYFRLKIDNGLIVISSDVPFSNLADFNHQ